MLDLDVIPTQSVFGSLVGISQPAVSDMVTRGVLSAEMTLRQMLMAYCSHIREQAAGRAASGDLDLAAERAALARAQRERIEMQNAVTRGELAPVAAIEEVLARAGSRVAGVLDAIPGMIRRRVAGLSAADIAIVAAEIAKARNIAAAVRLADLAEEAVADDEPVLEVDV